MTALMHTPTVPAAHDQATSQPSGRNAAAPGGETAAAADAHTRIREFLSFKLGAEEYGIDILRVQEIRSYETPMRMAGAPAFVKGVVNLRGVIVPVLDMRLKFGLADVAYDDFTVVIVLNIGERVLGLVVDGVSDVVTLEPAQLKPVPAFNTTIDASHLLAIGSVAERTLILLDIDRLLRSGEFGLFNDSF